MIPAAVPRYHGRMNRSPRTRARSLAVQALLDKPQLDRSEREIDRLLRETIAQWSLHFRPRSGQALVVTWTDHARIDTVPVRALCGEGSWVTR